MTFLMHIDAIIVAAALVFIGFVAYTEIFTLDIAAVLALVVLVVCGILTPEEAYGGLSSPPVITMCSVFCVTGALRRTGVADWIGSFLFRIAGVGEKLNVLVTVSAGALFSSIMPNLAATALFLPAVAKLSLVSRVSPSKLYIPLSFSTMLGGTLTIMGTAANILASGIIAERGGGAFGFFELTPFGLVLTIVGGTYLVIRGRHLLPQRDVGSFESRKRQLQSQYRLFERLLTVRVPNPSRLVGRSLRNLNIGEFLGARIVSIQRSSGEQLVPAADELLMEDDLLLVQARPEEFQALERFRSVTIESVSQAVQTKLAEHLIGASLYVTNPAYVGRTLSGIGIKDRYHLTAVAIERGGEWHVSHLAEFSLKHGDTVHVVGTSESIQVFRSAYPTEVKSSDKPLPEATRRALMLFKLSENSPLSGISLLDSQIGTLFYITAIGLLRDAVFIGPLEADFTLLSGDLMIVLGDSDWVHRVSEFSNLEVIDLQVTDLNVPTSAILAEVVLSPRSTLFGKTLEDIQFRNRYGIQVVAIWRAGAPIRARLGQKPLQLGDALLVEGETERVFSLSLDPDFVMLTEGGEPPKTVGKAPIAIAGLLGLVGLTVLGIVPSAVAAVISALFVVTFGAVTTDQAYRQDIEWKILIVMAAVLPFGLALDKVGLTGMLVSSLSNSSSYIGPMTMVVLIAVIASLISQILDNNLAVILLVPLSLELAKLYHLPPHTFAITAILGSSISFMTPASHRAHLLVMGPGGYKPADYWRIGLELSIVCLVTLSLMIAWVYKIQVTNDF